MKRSIYWSLIACLLATQVAWSQDRSERDAQLARQAVQKALQAELEGSPEERAKLLDEARQTSAKEPTSHWQAGDVQVGRDWKSYDQVVARAQKSKHLEQYREMRDKSAATFASQYELAAFCRKHNLKEQAQAHWSAIIELDPEHAEARAALGFVKVGDSWLRPTEMERERREATEVAEVIRKSSDDIKRLATELSSGTIQHEQAIQFLKKHSDIHAIPLWELALSSKHSAGALVVIDVLNGMEQPDATLSLARHAVWSPFPEARSAARGFLKRRDQNAYVPALLEELHGPFLAYRQVASNGMNRLTTRYTLVADSKEKVQLKVLDESFALTGDTRMASLLASSSTAIKQTQQEFTRRQLNAQQEQRNMVVMEALAELTDERELESPQDWWQWWDSKNEIYSTGLKPIDASYAYREYEVKGTLPLSTGSSSSSRRERDSDARKKDCLAGGTPILTERGPVNIERVRMGDLVLAKHADTGEVRLQPVLRTTIREPEPLFRITVESETKSGTSESVIRSSGGHPFWVSGKGWQRARLLESGMRLHGLNGFAVVKNVELENKSTRTFNLVIADFHSYFAGTAGVLTHDNSLVQPTTCKVPGMK